MVRKDVKLALNMIVKPSDDEAELLKRCLTNIAPHVDGIFLTITGENKRCEEVAEAFGAKVSHYEWDNHFANARNFALSQVPKEYTHWLWLDCDDVVRGADKIRKVIKDHPRVDGFTMNYLYHFDEHKLPDVVHLKTRILKNDGCVEWAGALHEDFKSNRKLEVHFLKDVEVLHLSDDERVQQSAERNVAIAEIDQEANPEDPRSYWNLGNALKMAGENERALEALETFLELSNSEEEKYIVRMRIAELHFMLGEKKKALENAQYAIGIRPHYPDAYHLAGNLLFEMKRFLESRDMYLQGLTRKPPYLSIIVYNPRDYDYVPLMNLAKVYFNLSMPQLALECLKGCLKIYPEDESLQKLVKDMTKQAKLADKVVKKIEKLRKIKSKKELRAALDKLPDDFKSHPMVCNLRNTRLIKKKSSGKDLVIMCGFTEEEWTPLTAMVKGIGGSEEAVIHLAKRFARRGWNVTVYNNCGHKDQVFNGVTYRPFWAWNPRDKQDVTIIWRHPRYADYEINSDKLILDMHDVIPAGEFTEARLEVIDKVMLKSKYHADLFPNVPDEKKFICANGIEWGTLQDDSIERDPMLLLNTSSPDRSILTLLECFEEVKKEVPKAKLKWAYGWGVWDVVHGDNPEAQAWKDKVMQKFDEIDGAEALGRVSHKEVAKLYQKAGIFAYPTAFAEIDCISARKAQAAGAIPVATDFAALETTIEHGIKIKTKEEKENWGKPNAMDFGLQDKKARKQWIHACINTLKNTPTEEERKSMRSAMTKFEWDEIADRWNEVLTNE